MKEFKVLVSVIISFVIVASCSKNNKTSENEGEYRVFGIIDCDTISADSLCLDSLSIDSLPNDSLKTDSLSLDSVKATISDSVLFLYIDNHKGLTSEKLVARGNKFEYIGKTSGLDELFLVTKEGKTVKFFASVGDQIEINIDKAGRPSFSPDDSLNFYFHNIARQLDTLKTDMRKDLLDSICGEFKTSLLPLLIMRDKMNLVTDSVFLRRCLGRMGSVEKPAWLTTALEQQFDRTGIKLKRNERLAALPKLRTATDSVYFDFKESRPNSNYLYFWAEHNKESVDSLQMLTPLAKEYGLHEYLFKFKSKNKNHRPKRIDILTICLYAKDSASWRENIKDVPGQHIWLQDGFSNPNIKAWHINKVPYNVIIDRFSNVQDSYCWGKALKEAIERQPNNFSYSTDGSNNNFSRSTRH